jgi:hypothetical protein
MKQPTTKNVCRLFLEIAQQGLGISQEIEFGQAWSPCSENFKNQAAQLLRKVDSETSLKFDDRSWLELAIQQAMARCDRELSHIQAKKTQGEPTKPVGNLRPTSSDKELVKVREKLGQRLMKIDRAFSQASERSMQPLGSWSSKVRGITNQLDIQDLEKTQLSNVFRLSIHASHLARMTRHIEHEIRSSLHADLRLIHQETCNATRAILSDGGLLSKVKRRFHFPRLRENEVWDSIENLITVGKETQIELPRKSLFDILTAGRQKVFMVIMFLSLMGRMGLPNLFQSTSSKTTFGLFLGGLMISSMVSTVLLWRREKTEQSSKELEKIRESLLQDATRIVEQVEKAKTTAWREFHKEVLASVESYLKLDLEESAASQRNQIEEEQRFAEGQRRHIDQRSKSLTEAKKKLEKQLQELRLATIPDAPEISILESESSVAVSKLPDAGVIPKPSPVSSASPKPEPAQPKAVDSSFNRASGLAARRLQRLNSCPSAASA